MLDFSSFIILTVFIDPLLLCCKLYKVVIRGDKIFTRNGIITIFNIVRKGANSRSEIVSYANLSIEFFTNEVVGR